MSESGDRLLEVTRTADPYRESPDDLVNDGTHCTTCGNVCGPWIGENEDTGYPRQCWTECYAFQSKPTVVFCEECVENLTEDALREAAGVVPADQMAYGIPLLVQWHSPDSCFAAVLVRDGKPWYLNGSAVGMGSTRGEAVDDLCGILQYLVIHGANFLTENPLPLHDRKWLFALLDPGSQDDEMYRALRDAEIDDTMLRTISGEPVTADNIVVWNDEMRADRDVLDQHGER